jgi:hypothetical protein
MSLAGRYLWGVAAVAAAGALIVWLVGAQHRVGVAWGVVVGLVLQAPLGWITLRAIGNERFLLLWALGMLVRLTVVAIAAMLVAPALEVGAGAMLGSMVGVLAALLLIEGITAAREYSREDER